MIRLTINRQTIEVEPGTTLLQAAGKLGVEVPTLCHREELPHYTSCMLCVVEEMNSGKLLPSCSAPAQDEMCVETDTQAVHAARKSALELLMSEHVGDCEGPCRLACPAHMNIPLMLRQIAAGDHASAVRTVRERIAIPAILGRICPAPCEKACRRKSVDEPVAICLLKRFAADENLRSGMPVHPKRKSSSGKRVAVVGAGPAGLSAAYYLMLAGHACTLLDAAERPGGRLRTDVPRDLLSEADLDLEIGEIMKLGVQWEPSTVLGRGGVTPESLRSAYDAVILAFGEKDRETILRLGLEYGDRGVQINPDTFETALIGLFAGGGAVHPGKLAVRSAGHGWSMALSADQFLTGVQVTGPPRRYQSRIGRVFDDEMAEFMKASVPDSRKSPAGGTATGFQPGEAEQEALRCLHCDCRKPEQCRLRDYAGVYRVSGTHFKSGERLPVEKINSSKTIIFEPGKCIKCGICVRITAESKEKLGLALINRGFQVKVTVPFGESLESGLEQTAAACVQACPTGALAFIKEEDNC